MSATSTTAKKTQSSPIQPVSAALLHKGAVIYVALGASDAVGVGTKQPGSQGYVPLVENRLPVGSHLIDLGISGIHLHEAIQQELPLALTTHPQLITIWLVANDFIGGVSYDSYMQDLNSLLQQLRAGTTARIVMANLPDLTLLPLMANQKAAQKTQTRAQIERWNKQIDVIAQQYHVAVVDLFSKNSEITSHPENISGDGFHPSAAGYVLISDYFWTAINS